MPTWWRPTIHDLGFMVGSVLHGLLLSDAILHDDSLRMSDKCLGRHIALTYAKTPFIKGKQVDELARIAIHTVGKRTVLEERYVQRIG